MAAPPERLRLRLSGRTRVSAKCDPAPTPEGLWKNLKVCTGSVHRWYIMPINPACFCRRIFLWQNIKIYIPAFMRFFILLQLACVLLMLQAQGLLQNVDIEGADATAASGASEGAAAAAPSLAYKGDLQLQAPTRSLPHPLRRPNHRCECCEFLTRGSVSVSVFPNS